MIDSTGKVGQPKLDITSLTNKKFEVAVDENTGKSNPSTKTYLSESSNQTKIKDPYQELSDFMKMTDAQKMQYLWLKKHGISQEEFDAMSGEDKQKLVEQMQEEIKKQIQKAAETSDNTSVDIT